MYKSNPAGEKLLDVMNERTAKLLDLDKMVTLDGEALVHYRTSVQEEAAKQLFEEGTLEPLVDQVNKAARLRNIHGKVSTN